MIIECSISNPEVNTGIVEKTEIQKGVYLSNCLVTVKHNQQANVSILNTTNSEVKVQSLLVEIQPCQILDNSNSVSKIHSLQPTISSSNSRLTNIKNQIRLEHLNQEEARDRILCSQRSLRVH